MPFRFALLIALLAFSGASAHDLWLIPPEKAAAKDTVKILAHSGMEFPKSVHAPDPAKFSQRRVFDPSGKESTVDAAGSSEKSGLLSFTPAKSGVFIVAVEAAPKLISLKADAFNAFAFEAASASSLRGGSPRGGARSNFTASALKSRNSAC